MATVDELVVQIGADISSLKKALKEAQSGTERASTFMSRAMDKFSNRVKESGKELNRWGGVAVVGAAGSLAYMVKQTINAQDQMGKLSDRLGVSTEGLSELRHVANLSGVSFETLTLGLQRMTRRVAEAAQGTGEAKGALKELGITATQLTQLRPEQQFELIADAISKVGNQSDRVRLAMKLFDSEGVSLLQTMTSGAAGIRDMRKEAHDLGLTVTNDMAKAAADANDALTRLTAVSGGFANSLAADVAPGLTRVIKAMSEAYKESGLLTSIWVGLGGAAAEAFGLEGSAADDATQQVIAHKVQLRDTKEQIEKLQGTVATYKTQLEALQNAQADPAAIAYFRNLIATYEKDIARLQGKLGQLKTTAKPPEPAAPVVTAPAKEDPETVRLKQSLANQMAAMQQHYMDQRELAVAAFAERAQIITDLEAQNIGTEEERRMLALQSYGDYQRALTDIEITETERRQELARQEMETKLATTSQIFSGLASLMSTKSKKLFEIGKKAAIAQATIDTLRGAASAFADTPGPVWVKAAAGVAALAIGYSRVKAIQGQSFGGGGGGGMAGGGTGGGAGVTGEPVSAAAPTAQQEQATQLAQRHDVSIVVSGGIHDDEAMRALVRKMDEINKDMGGAASFVPA